MKKLESAIPIIVVSVLLSVLVVKAYAGTREYWARRYTYALSQVNKYQEKVVYWQGRAEYYRAEDGGE